MNLEHQPAETGGRSTLRHKSGKPVADSGPVLKGPTSPATAGRKPEARPLSPPQPNSRREREGRALAEGAGREAPALSLGQQGISGLRAFFKLLDRWDREAAHANEAM